MDWDWAPYSANNDSKTWFRVPKVCPGPKGTVFIHFEAFGEMSKVDNVFSFYTDQMVTMIVKTFSSENVAEMT